MTTSLPPRELKRHVYVVSDYKRTDAVILKKAFRDFRVVTRRIRRYDGRFFRRVFVHVSLAGWLFDHLLSIPCYIASASLLEDRHPHPSAQLRAAR